MEQAVLGVNAVFPSGEHGTWSLCEFLLPHALTCAKSIPVLRQQKLEGMRLLSVTGRYLLERAQYEEAEPLYQRALLICEKQLGAAHPFQDSVDECDSKSNERQAPTGKAAIDANWAKWDRRVLPRGMFVRTASIRTRLTATAVKMCCTWVLASPS